MYFLKKQIVLLSIILTFLGLISLNAQELHTHSNAANITNESNSTDGWGGNVIISSVSTEVYSGNYSLKLEANNDGWERAQYGLDLTIGDEYEIIIYAKKTANSPSPSITNWSGFNFNGKGQAITNTNWQEYKFNVVATGDRGVIKVYVGTQATTGNTVYIDNVSIRNLSSGNNTSDTQAPTAPTLSSTGQTETTASLSWSGAIDNVGVTGYMVYKDGTLENTLGNVLSYNVTGLNPNTSYNFTVKALDAAGNESLLSNTATATTNSSADTQDPTAPTLVENGKTVTTVNLSWSGATDNTAVTGYRIFKDGTLETTLSNVGTYQVTGLTENTTYSFNATALDAAGNESTGSNAITVTTDASSGGSGSNVTWTKSGSNVSMESTTDNLAIGRSTVPNGYKLAVDGNIRTREVRVDQDSWPDYVFEEGYDLLSLSEMQKHIREKGHLPNIPSAKEVEANGIELGEMNKLLLEKIEELTLYIIQLKKENERQQEQINKLLNKK